VIANFFEVNFPEWKDEPEGGPAYAAGALEEEAREVAEKESRIVDMGLHPDPELKMLNIRRLYSFVRDPMKEEGSRKSQQLRERGLLPSFLQGGDPTKGILGTDRPKELYLKIPWFHVQRELDKYRWHFESRVYEMTVFSDESDSFENGATPLSVHRVIPRNLQMHPLYHKAYSVNFLRYHPGRVVELPIRYINEEESPALKRGGFIIPIKRFVPCLIEEGVPIPETIDLECTGVQLGDVLRTERLIMPDGVRFADYLDPKTFLVGPVKGSRRGMLDEEGGGAGGKEVDDNDED